MARMPSSMFLRRNPYTGERAFCTLDFSAEKGHLMSSWRPPHHEVKLPLQGVQFPFYLANGVLENSLSDRKPDDTRQNSQALGEEA